MKVSILTFQFAHNYGALLQSYSLKKCIESLGHEVELAPYYPDWARREYAINPFVNGLSIKKRLRFAYQYSKRKKLADVFQEFQKDMLQLKKSFGNLQTFFSSLKTKVITLLFVVIIFSLIENSYIILRYN